MNMIDANFKKMNDVELLTILNTPSTDKKTKDKVLTTLWLRYQPQIHNNWWKLQRQMNNNNAVNLMKSDYYDEATDAFFVAISKIKMDRIENDKFKCVGMIDFYLRNVRKKIIKKIIKTPPTKSITMMNNISDEGCLSADKDVEESYWNNEGYATEPSYIMEMNYREKNINKIIDDCKKKWNDDEISMFNEIMTGNKKAEIIKRFNMSEKDAVKMYNKVKNDLRVMYKKYN